MGPVIRAKYDSFWLGHVFAVVLNSPDDIKIVMNSDKCFEKYPTYQFYFKYGLFTEGGEKYKQQKKSLNPLFMPSNLKTLIPIINENFKHFMSQNEKNMEGKEFSMKPLASKFTINTVLGTLVGLGTKMFSDETLEEVIERADEYLKSCSGRLFKMWMHPDFMYRLTKEYQKKKVHLRKILDLAEELFEENDAKNIDGITYFTCMKNHLDKMEYEEYSESLALFLGAAYETTAGTILAIFFLLSLNPDKQENLYNEISSILTSSDDEVTEKMMNEMHYLDLVIKESLRLLPVAVFSARMTTDDVEFSKFFT
jgi:cytochrome P450